LWPEAGLLQQQEQQLKQQEQHQWQQLRQPTAAHATHSYRCVHMLCIVLITIDRCVHDAVNWAGNHWQK
jgi:membrane-anchored protein YejM (alkaline phosphatase superfamily)